METNIFIVNIFICLALVSFDSVSSCHKKRNDPRPYCGSNGVTYYSLCDFTAAKRLYPGLEVEGRKECACGPSEKYQWDPICGTDQDSYANPCEFSKAKSYNKYLKIRHRDLCGYLLKKEALSKREFEKIYRWREFMPSNLFADFFNRPVYDGNVIIPMPDTLPDRNNNCNWCKKHKKSKKCCY